MNQTITLTFCEAAENHAGMQIIGKKSLSGFSFDLCQQLAQQYSGEFYDLSLSEPKEAGFVIFRNGIKTILGINPDDVYKEQSELETDKKCFMYGRVVNKKARYNLCFAEQSQQADYENKKGTIVSFEDVPKTNQIREQLGTKFGKEFIGLFAEGNYYYDTKKCYIGFHGDSERKKVVGIRLGADFPIYFRWHSQAKVHKDYSFMLKHGDIYIMSEKTTGNDWKKRSQKHLRHAAGFCVKN